MHRTAEIGLEIQSGFPHSNKSYPRLGQHQTLDRCVAPFFDQIPHYVFLPRDEKLFVSQRFVGGGEQLDNKSEFPSWSRRIIILDAARRPIGKDVPST